MHPQNPDAEERSSKTAKRDGRESLRAGYLSITEVQLALSIDFSLSLGSVSRNQSRRRNLIWKVL